MSSWVAERWRSYRLVVVVIGDGGAAGGRTVAGREAVV